MKVEKKEFNVTVDGIDKIYFVKAPSARIKMEAAKYKAEVFKREINKKDENGKSTAIFADQVYNLLKEQGLWSDEDDKELLDVTTKIKEKLALIKAGKSDKIKSKLEVRKIILEEISELRYKQLLLYRKLQIFDKLTVEEIARQAEFDYKVAHSTYDDAGELAYESVEDYYDKQDEPYTEKAGATLESLESGNVDSSSWLEENKILKQYGFLNSEGKYVINGKLVNVAGKLVNSDGNLVNENGDLVDEDGNLVDKDGKRIDFVEFDD